MVNHSLVKIAGCVPSTMQIRNRFSDDCGVSISSSARAGGLISGVFRMKDSRTTSKDTA